MAKFLTQSKIPNLKSKIAQGHSQPKVPAVRRP